MRFETPPGHQLQIDVGTVRVPVGDEPTKVHLFVAMLGYQCDSVHFTMQGRCLTLCLRCAVALQL